MKLLRTLLFVLAVLPLPAFAQYVATAQAGVSYPALTNATPVVLTAPGSNDVTDKGRVTIPIGFDFPFYSRTYSAITVTANGLAFLEPSTGANSDADFPANQAIPNGAEPNAIIAPLWDDLIGSNATSVLHTQSVTGSNGTGLAIEWKDWNRVFGAFTLNFQIRLWENGVVEFFYGTMTGSGATAISATIGIESGTGTAGTRGLSVCTADCSLMSFDPNGTGSVISYIRFGPPVGIDVQAVSLRVDGITTAGSTLTVASTLAVRNFGTVASGAFPWRLYLSQDTQSDSSDLPLTPNPANIASLNPLQATTASANGSVARPDGGSWYVLAVIPPIAGETNDFNNVVASSVPYAGGVDLIAESVTAPPIAGPGDPLSIDVAFSNQGFETAGAVQVKLYASVDTNLTSDDRLLSTQNVNVVGGQQIQQPLGFTLSPLTPADDYYVIMQLDSGPDAGAIAELNEANNVVTSRTRMQVRQADLTVTEVRVLRADAPYDAISDVFMGEPARLEAYVSNIGGATANNVVISYYLSDNQALNGVTDKLIGNVTAQHFSAGESKWVVLPNSLVPSTTVQGQPLPVGAYFVFASATAIGTQETNPTNNFTNSTAVILRAPAPNLVPVEVLTPLNAGAGEVVAISRSFANLGNRNAPIAKYRFYLSANTIITTQDAPLAIVTPTGDATEGTVTLAIDQRDSAVELVRLPQSLSPAQYFIGALIDPDDEIVEADETDNGLAGLRTEIAPAALGVANTVLPDSRIGVPYAVQLIGRGGTGTYTFTPVSLPPGLTLSATGLLSGTPTQVGAFTLFFTITSGTTTITIARGLRISSLTSSLQIATQTLPAPIRALSYDVHLAARGGVAPYAWAVIDGTLPTGLALSGAGVFSGTPIEEAGAMSTFTVRVTDAIGNVDDRAFATAIVDVAPFTIGTRMVLDGLVGTEYAQAIAVINPANAPVVTPIRWTLASGALPDGLILEASSSESVFISGTPTRSGRFVFEIEAVDAQGRTDSVRYIMSIASGAIAMTGTGTRFAIPGDAVSITFTATPLPDGARYFLREGTLPAGVTFSEDGTITGTVAADATLAPYTLLVSVGPRPEAPVTMMPWTLEVSTTRPVTRGCSTIGGSLFAMLSMLWLVRARRR